MGRMTYRSRRSVAVALRSGFDAGYHRDDQSEEAPDEHAGDRTQATPMTAVIDRSRSVSTGMEEASQGPDHAGFNGRGAVRVNPDGETSLISEEDGHMAEHETRSPHEAASGDEQQQEYDAKNGGGGARDTVAQELRQAVREAALEVLPRRAAGHELGREVRGQQGTGARYQEPDANGLESGRGEWPG
jgi:hypothetical protein